MVSKSSNRRVKASSFSPSSLHTHMAHGHDLIISTENMSVDCVSTRLCGTLHTLALTAKSLPDWHCFLLQIIHSKISDCLLFNLLNLSGCTFKLTGSNLLSETPSKIDGFKSFIWEKKTHHEVGHIQLGIIHVHSSDVQTAPHTFVVEPSYSSKRSNWLCPHNWYFSRYPVLLLPLLTHVLLLIHGQSNNLEFDPDSWLFLKSSILGHPHQENCLAQMWDLWMWPSQCASMPWYSSTRWTSGWNPWAF